MRLCGDAEAYVRALEKTAVLQKPPVKKQKLAEPDEEIGKRLVGLRSQLLFMDIRCSLGAFPVQPSPAERIRRLQRAMAR